jgi:hypothetical protein
MAYGTINADVIGTSVAGSNIGAGNASIMKNRIINGAMTITQGAAAATITPAVTSAYATNYPVDRFQVIVGAASKLTTAQSSTAATGFNFSTLITSSSAYTVGAGEVFSITQKIEGFNTADLAFGTANALTVTLSFWVRSSLTGTFGGSLQNSAASRSYPFSYTISVANTWEQKTITVVGDTTGTWIGATNGVGLTVNLGLGVGSTYSGTANAWAASDYRSATGATSVVGTSGATFYITGVQLEVGSSATGFEYVNYQTSLANCQRYYQYVGGNQGTYTLLAVGNVFNGTLAYGGGFLRTTMRSAPTFAITGTAGTDFRYQTNSDGDLTPSAIANDNSRSDSYTLAITVSGRTSGQAFRLFNITTTGSITFSAEL